MAACRFLLLVSAVLATMLTPGSGMAQEVQAPPTFRSSVDVVSVAAVVRDRQGRIVRHLSRDDFEVLESGEQRPILDVRAEAGGPVRLALLFDVSGSMRLTGRFLNSQDAARHLLKVLEPPDAAGIFTFDTRVRQIHEISRDLASVEAALAEVDRPFGQTSLYDAIAATARLLADGNRRDAPQRRALIVFTDGVDTGSSLSPGQVSAIASAIDVPVYILVVTPEIDSPERPGMRPRGEDLRHLAYWTGGEALAASIPAQAATVARRIVEELRHQYVVAFEASPAPGWRPLEVRARNRAFRVRARAGYTAGVRESSAVVSSFESVTEAWRR